MDEELKNLSVSEDKEPKWTLSEVYHVDTKEVLT